MGERGAPAGAGRRRPSPRRTPLAEGGFAGRHGGKPAGGSLAAGGAEEEVVRKLEIDLRKQELEAIMQQVREIGRRLSSREAAAVVSFRPPARGPGEPEGAPSPPPPPPSRDPLTERRVLISPFIARGAGRPRVHHDRRPALPADAALNRTPSRSSDDGGRGGHMPTPGFLDELLREMTPLRAPGDWTGGGTGAGGSPEFTGEQPVAPSGESTRDHAAAEAGCVHKSMRVREQGEQLREQQSQQQQATIAQLQRQLYNSMQAHQKVQGELSTATKAQKEAEAAAREAKDEVEAALAVRAAAEQAARGAAEEALAQRERAARAQGALEDLEATFTRRLTQESEQAAQVYKQRLASETARADALQEKYATAATQLASAAEAQREVGGASDARIGELEQALSRVGAERDGSLAREQAATEKLREAEGELGKYVEARGELRALQGKLRAQQDELERLEEELGAAVDRQRMFETQNSKLRQQSEAVRKAHINLQASHEDTRGALAVAEEQLRVRERAVVAQKSGREADRQKDRTAQAELQKKVVAATEEVEAQRQRANEHEAGVRKAERRVQSLEVTLAQLNGVLKEKDQEAHDQNAAVEALRAAHAAETEDLRCETVELRMEAEGAAVRAKESAAEVATLRDELAEAKVGDGAEEARRQLERGKLEEAREQARLAHEESMMKDVNLNLLEEKVAELEGRVRRRNAMIENLEAEMRERREAAEVAEAAAAAAAVPAAAEAPAAPVAPTFSAPAEAEVKEARTRAAEFEDRSKSLEQAVARLEAELLEKEGTINILQDSLK